MRRLTPWLLLIGAGAVLAVALRLSGSAPTTVASGWLRTDDGRLPNIVLLTVDTLRADHVHGTAPRDWHLTPSLGRLAARGTLFEATRSPASATKPGLAGLMTGSYPHRHKVTSNFGSIPADVPLLATILRRHGYETAAVVGNRVVNERSGLQRGFARFASSIDKNKVPHDDVGVDLALGWLDTAPRTPWLLWLHLMAPHGPYNSGPPVAVARDAPDPLPDAELRPSTSNYGLGPIIPRYQILAVPPRAAAYRRRYRDEVAFVDAQIGRFLDELDRRGHGSTLVIFTADHGEGLGENDYFFQHGWLVNEPSLRVPMIWSQPGRIREGHRVPETTSLVDVLPTLLTGLGIPPPPVDGTDVSAALLGGGLHERTVFGLSAYPNELSAAIRGTWKLVHTPEPPRPLPEDHWHDDYPSRESWVLHDLADDPLETRDASAESPRVLAELQEQLRAWERANGLPIGMRGTPPIDPGTAEGLRALGYVD